MSATRSALLPAARLRPALLVYYGLSQALTPLFLEREFGLGTGLVDNKVAAVDDVWSGLRFVRRLADR